jgi:hypothetical protein
MGTWGDSAYGENQRDISGYKSPWRTPTGDSNQWKPPGHTRAFHDGDPGMSDDPVKRGFTTRKKHGWWGKEEFYDMDGRKIG